ncbi:murein biosynthesis integral membrane protein MurJ, partial [Cellulomonas carbonis]
MSSAADDARDPSGGDGTGRGGLGRSTAVMAAGTATSRVFGLLRVVALAAVIGSAGISADSFQAAYWLPNVIYMLVAGGVLNAVLVPQILKAYRTSDGDEYVDRLLTVSAVVIAVVTVVATAASPLVVQLVVSQQTPEFKALTVAFAIWSIPQVFFYGLYTLLGQVLNARGRFGPYMWAPVVNNVVAIAGIGLFGLLYGRVGELQGDEVFAFWTAGPVSLLAGTATLGVVAQALVLVWPLRRAGFRWTPRRGWRGVGLSSAARVAGWTFAALVVGQVGILAVVNVSSAASDAVAQGAVVAGNNHYSIAFTVFMLPHSLVTVSLVTAMYTRLSGRAAAHDTDGVRRDFSTGLRLIGVFTSFATAVLVVLALPVSRALLFADARPEASTALAPVVVTMSCGLVALGAWSLVQRVYYAYEDARALFLLQVPMAVVVALGSVLGWLLLPPQWWTASAGAAISASYALGAVRGLLGVRTRLGGIGDGALRLHVRAGVAAVGAGLVGWAVSRVFGEVWDASLLEVLAVCAVVGLVMLVVYVALLRLMRVRELEDLAAPLLRRAGLRRSMGPPGSGAGAPASAVVPPAEATGTTATPPWPGAGHDDGLGHDGSGQDDGPQHDRSGHDDGPQHDDGTGRPGTTASARTHGTTDPVVTTPRTAPSGPAGQHGGDLLVPAIGRGTQLAGRYRLDQPAGSDLPGVECWHATDVILDRPVRVCLLREGRVREGQDAARRAALVTDPRLLRVLDVGDHDDVAYVATEPLRGRSLAELTQRGPLPAAQARAVIGEAAVALEVARRRGVHHLALRPSSVRVTSDGGVLVTGLAMDGEVLGHPAGDARATTRADTVGLVGLLYLALTGRWPVPAGVDPDDVRPAPVVQGSPVAPADLSTAVPNDLDTLCAVTLGPHDDGPHSPAELVHELEPWADVDVAAIDATPTGWEVDAPAVHGSADVPDDAEASGTATDAPDAATETPDAGGGTDAGAPGDGDGGTTVAVPVARQSVRDSFAAQTPPAAPPGT